MSGVLPQRRGFTLIEVLVVVAILALLIAILIPALVIAKESALRTACLSNLHQVGVAIQSYANENEHRIPFGPNAPPMQSALDFYPVTGAPTSLLSLWTGSPVGAGLLLTRHLARQPQVLFCPGSDQKFDADAELAKVGRQQAQGSYYYRHGSITQWYDPVTSPPPEHIRLDNLGRNRQNPPIPIRALLIDTQFPAAPGFAAFGIMSRTHHRGRWTNILACDGHAASRSNADGRFTVDLNDYDGLMNAFDRILGALEAADRE